MTITRNFKLCLNAGTQNAPYINVNQYDEGEEWVFDLYTEGGQKFVPSTGAIIGIKSDGNAILNSGTVNASGQVVITETQQMTAASGLAVFELLIEGETHGTANFIVNVERRPSDDAEFSDSDISMLQEAIDAAEVINEILDEGGDPSEIITENVNNWLDNHPEATTTVQDGAITAPKINNSLWDKILVNEEVSGNPASFEDGADDVPVSSLKVALEPIQTGTGDPSPTNIRPIVASNGKNILPLTVASCQSNSTAGTWNGNAYTHLGVTYTLNTGADGTVESVTINGTSTGASELRIALVSFDPTKTYKVNGITGATSSTYRFNIGGVGTYYDNDYTVTFEDTSEHICRLQVPNGVSVSNATVQPMIRLDGTDSTYQPYQGIIVERTGKNLIKVDSTTWSDYNVSKVYWGQNASGIVPMFNKLSAGTYTFTYKEYVDEVNNTSIGTYGVLLRRNVNGTNIDVDARISNVAVSAPQLLSNSVTFTLTEADVGTFQYVYLYSGFPSQTTQNKARFYDFQLERGSEATEYEPFTFTSYPYSLGQSVYGGTVDLATGVLTVTHGIVDLGSLTWNVFNANNTYTATPQNMASIITPPYTNRQIGAICSSYPPSSSYVYDMMDDKSWLRYRNSIIIHDNSYTDATAFTTAMNGVQLVYELAEPQTHQLTPTEVKTLLGYNNISSSGSVDVIYHADTKLYVDKMTAVDNNVIAPTEKDFVATQNYTTGDLVIVNDTLYKVTANIASGSTITPNSNVQQTTLGALIKALS